jgi:hypothetical protein
VRDQAERRLTDPVSNASGESWQRGFSEFPGPASCVSPDRVARKRPGFPLAGAFLFRVQIALRWRGAGRYANVMKRGAMSRFIAATAASLLALAASPAAAQYGGSPDQQIDPPAAYAGKGDGQAAPGPQAYDKDQGDDQAEGPPPGEDEDDPAGPPPGAYDRDGPAQCRRSDGTTGAIVGGGAGALVGRGIDRHGERGTGTIIGAVLGALIGHAVEQGACR